MKWHGILLALLSLIVTTDLKAQSEGKINNGLNVEKFPEVSFVYHSYNPDTLDKSKFWFLKEGGNAIDFKVTKLPAVRDSLPQTTLILWEDMGYTGREQFDFISKTLIGFFNQGNIRSSDKFAISAFNRRKNTPSVLIDITNGFTDKRSDLLSAIQGYKHNTETYKEFQNRSDLYAAIKEGLDLLAPLKGTKSIIVFTAGYPMINSGSDSEAQVLLKAQQLHIPVYIFQYYNRSGIATASEGFANSTYGGFMPFKDALSAQDSMIALYSQISRRYHGNDYKISFKSAADRGDEARMIVMSVDGMEVQEQLLPPAHTVGTWIASHLWLVIVVGLVIIGLCIYAILFIRKTKKNTAKNRQELDDLGNRLVQEREEAERTQREREILAQKEKAQQETLAEEKRLAHLMGVKNLYPRLKCSAGSNQFTYEMSKPGISIGREEDNDVIFANNGTVSRHHAEIKFDGSCFEIVDKQSTNKVIVNGQFVERAVLKSGDIIGLGEAVIVFWC